MSKYFYSDGVNQFGPFSFEELKDKNLSRETLVWYQGLEQWAPAGKLSELSGLFEYVPPTLVKPMQQTQQTIIQNTTTAVPPKTWLVESILITLFCCLPFGIAGIVNASSVESKFYAGDIEGAQRASKEAGKWTKVGFWCGMGIAALYVIYIVVLLVIGGMAAVSDYSSF